MASAPPALQFSDSLQCLFVPKRLKVLWGGRSAGRSWGCARALLTLARGRRIRVLCAREFQNSIEESVHRVLKSQIEEELKWGHLFNVEKQKIVGLEQGSEFLFEGIKNNTTRIKSYEGIDYCWIEEGAKLSRESWKIIEPTIRGEKSELWITLNPELETDFVYATMIKDRELRTVEPGRFAQPVRRVWETKPGEFKGMMSVKMTWEDNPWLPTTMRDSMEDMKEKDYDSYLNVWEGFPKQALEGAVYKEQLRRAQEEERICSVPWERTVPVDTYWDLGKGDATVIWFVQQVAMQIRVLDYFTADGLDVEDYIKVLQRKQYAYGIHVLPHDAEHKRLGMKKTIKEQFESYYPGKVRIARKIALMDGINMTRMLFPNMWFDEANCEEGLNTLRHYCYAIKDGQRSKEPNQNWAGHTADALRYMAVTIRDPDMDRGAELTIRKLEEAWDGMRKKARDTVGGGLSWMGF